MDKLAPEEFEIVVPSLSILAEPPVTVVDQAPADPGNQATVTILFSSVEVATFTCTVTSVSYHGRRDAR